jgi:transcriptional regulator with XRE-family HTH domain
MARKNNFKQLRKQKSFSILELAAVTGVSTATIVGIERYNLYPGPSVRVRLAKALKISEAAIWPETAEVNDGTN